MCVTVYVPVVLPARLIAPVTELMLKPAGVAVNVPVLTPVMVGTGVVMPVWQNDCCV
jgi:hypothetical protein